jgi:hypothetical protein
MQSGLPARDHMQNSDYVCATNIPPHGIGASVAIRNRTQATAYSAAVARILIQLFVRLLVFVRSSTKQAAETWDYR